MQLQWPVSCVSFQAQCPPFNIKGSLNTIPKTRVWQILPAGQSWPVACFYIACELRMVLHDQLVEKKIKRTFLTCDNYMKFKIQCPQIKFHWYMAHSFFMEHLGLLSPCSGRVEELQHKTVWLAKPKLFSIYPFAEKVC
jgi:hypothetical protein